jgi:hypothetical protein
MTAGREKQAEERSQPDMHGTQENVSATGMSEQIGNGLRDA